MDGWMVYGSSLRLSFLCYGGQKVKGSKSKFKIKVEQTVDNQTQVSEPQSINQSRIFKVA